MLDFRVLGPLEVMGERGLIRLGGPRQRGTLAILVLNHNRVVSVERLADDLYAGAPPVTAVTQVQRQISDLRRALGPELVIETRPPGYMIRLSPEQVDLVRFERQTEQARGALAGGRPEVAADLLRQALGLWRGAPLADLAHESFAQPAITRLEEIRLAALDERIDADLALGRHSEVIGELEALVVEYPLRERLRGQLMLALYRSGRQVEALDAYRRAHEALVQGFGIEPTPALRELERAILVQDPSLEAAPAAAQPGSAAEPARAVLVLAADDERLERLLTVPELFEGLRGRELIVVRVLRDANELDQASAIGEAVRERLSACARIALFSTRDVVRDLARLAAAFDVELVIVASGPLADDALPDDLTQLLERSPADVALLTGATAPPAAGAGVFVPFAGSDNDWAALELGAWLASSTGAPLRVVGAARGGEDEATRLLADASLAVWRVTGVKAEPLFAESSVEGLLAAVESGSLIIAGLSPRWRHEGLGSVRQALARAAPAPVLLVHRGARPGALAPYEARTRFTWTIEAT